MVIRVVKVIPSLAGWWNEPRSPPSQLSAVRRGFATCGCEAPLKFSLRSKSKLQTQSLPSCDYLIVVRTGPENKWRGHLGLQQKKWPLRQETGFIWTIIYITLQIPNSVYTLSTCCAHLIYSAPCLKPLNMKKKNKYDHHLLILFIFNSRERWNVGIYFLMLLLCNFMHQGSRSTWRLSLSCTTSTTVASSAWRRSTPDWCSWGQRR